jgi:hypothetical protein
MGSEIVVLEETEIRDQPVLTLLDEKLRKALTAKSGLVAVCMRPEIGCNTGLLEWLEAWNRRFRNVNKAFFIIPATPTQLECLEVSHPDMDLRYVTSVDKLPVIEPRIVEPEPSAPVAIPVQQAPPAGIREAMPDIVRETVPEPGNRIAAKAVAAHQATMIKQAPAEPPVIAAVVTFGAEEKTAVSATNSMDYAPPAVHMKAGSTVKLAGEYICSMCKISRMWLKGDKAANCENPECRNPSAGWDLTCELF